MSFKIHLTKIRTTDATRRSSKNEVTPRLQLQGVQLQLQMHIILDHLKKIEVHIVPF